MEKRVFCQLNGNRKVIGVLRGYDVRDASTLQSSPWPIEEIAWSLAYWTNISMFNPVFARPRGRCCYTICEIRLILRLTGFHEHCP